jgi:dTDP-4-dehydrorhamnose reductase
VIQLSILGAHGQVGCALAALARKENVPHRAFGRADCDITDRLAVKRAVAGSRMVVNCAAYTAVDRAESDAHAAYRVNSLGAENIAAACAAEGIPLVHLSTDYVFAGASSRPATEDDPPQPLNVYGRSKLDGELKVRERLASHILLRTSWVFSAYGPNFVKRILHRARSQSELRVVNDQIGGPTAADDLAVAILRMADHCKEPGFRDWGTYHFSGAPPVSWYDFACAVLADFGAPVLPVATKDFPTAARRPPNSVLDCSQTLRVFGIAQPDWRSALSGVRAAVLGELNDPPIAQVFPSAESL